MEHKRKIYRIPSNFKDSGYILNGMIAVRNAIDAVWLGAIGYSIARTIPFGEGALTGHILLIGLFAVVGITGINEVPVSTFLADVFKWRSRREPYIYNSHGRAYTVTAADVMLNTPGFRDTLADALDKAKATMQTKKMDYIEGETFRFAADPELEELSYAEERNQELQEEPEKKDSCPTQEVIEQPVPQNNDILDFQSIADNIVLHDIDEE